MGGACGRAPGGLSVGLRILSVGDREVGDEGAILQRLLLLYREVVQPPEADRMPPLRERQGAAHPRGSTLDAMGRPLHHIA